MSLHHSERFRDEVRTKSLEEDDNECMSFLPFASVEKLIDKHPIISIMGVTKEEVHKCMSHMLSYKLSLKTKKGTVNEHSQQVKANHCTQCDKPMLIAYRDGHFTCSQCGIVSSKNVYGEHFVRTLTEEELNVGGEESEIPKWAFAQNAYAHIWTEIQLSKDVDHWNAHMNLREDDLIYVKRVASWMKRRASNESRVAAAFLFFYLECSIDIESYNSSTFEYPEVTYNVISSLGQCDNCEEHFYSNFSKRNHSCFVKERSRVQWAYSKNKECRMKLI